MLKFYGYKKCSTCAKAEKELKKRGIEYKYIDITEKPPAKSALKKIWKQSSVELKKLLNTSGVVYREQNMKEKIKTISESELFETLAGEGRLIKRPLITDGEHSTVGFKDPSALDVFS